MINSTVELEKLKTDFEKFCKRHNSCANCRYVNEPDTDCFYLFIHDYIRREEEWQMKLERKSKK